MEGSDTAATDRDIGSAGYLETGRPVDKGVAACHGRLVYSGTADPKAAATLEQVGTAAADVRTYQHINKVRFSITKPSAIIKLYSHKIFLAYAIISNIYFTF